MNPDTTIHPDRTYPLLALWHDRQRNEALHNGPGTKMVKLVSRILAIQDKGGIAPPELRAQFETAQAEYNAIMARQKQENEDYIIKRNQKYELKSIIQTSPTH